MTIFTVADAVHVSSLLPNVTQKKNRSNLLIFQRISFTVKERVYEINWAKIYSTQKYTKFMAFLDPKKYTHSFMAHKN